MHSSIFNATPNPLISDLTFNKVGSMYYPTTLLFNGLTYDITKKKSVIKTLNESESDSDSDDDSDDESVKELKNKYGCNNKYEYKIININLSYYDEKIFNDFEAAEKYLNEVIKNIKITVSKRIIKE